MSRNLYLQITPGGTKSWLFRYTRDGVAHGMGLGPYDLVSLAEARAKALAARRQLLEGTDPLVEHAGPPSSRPGLPLPAGTPSGSAPRATSPRMLPGGAT